jgi:diguanylate cyclase (GGDEF)-like protein
VGDPQVNRKHCRIVCRDSQLAERTVLAVKAPRFGRPQDNSKPSGWDRTRLGVVVPLCVVVAVAIVCIVVAALTSAHQANQVAFEREKQLLTRAINNHGEWSLRRLQTITMSDSSVAAEDIDQASAQLSYRLSSWFAALLDHDLVVLVDSADRIVHTQLGMGQPETALLSEAVPRLQSLIEYLRQRTAALPERTITIVGDRPTNGTRSGEAVFLHDIKGKLAVVTTMPIPHRRDDDSAASSTSSPMVMTVRIVGPSLLASISDRLQLTNLRMIENGQARPEDNIFELTDGRQQAIARFAWTPRRPGAEILNSVIPFIGIALAGFALLAALVLHYMRHTAATIAAGENRLRYLALHDPLCGLPNRNFFGERLEAVIADVRRGGTPAAVFYIDLDHFKDVNDTLGHPIGDELIRNVTLRLSRMLRGDDLVARLGGDEFAVISSASSDLPAMENMADRLIAILSAPYSINGHTIVIGASVGIAVIDHRSGVGSADIMRYADMALYRAKNEGRNRACIYDSVMDADLSQRKLVEQDLREAIEHDHLKVLYQPIVNASGERVVAVEALARWPHPTRGLISPADFIPIAEHSGLIIELGARVLRRACLDGMAWPGIDVSVNVSPLQFRQLDFVSVVERILSETGFDPARLELEITESTLLGNVDSAELAMRRLKVLGVQLALDDFGTGYSSLLYLRRFPFDKLKIDRSFVLSIEKAADAAAIVHAIVSLGRGLGMKVTAEGVESAEQHLFLRAAGVHCMQGFRFGVPSQPGEVSERLATPGVYRSIEGDAAAALAS